MLVKLLNHKSSDCFLLCGFSREKKQQKEDFEQLEQEIEQQVQKLELKINSEKSEIDSMKEQLHSLNLNKETLSKVI